MKEESRLKFGLIHYYYGNGRGKTSTLVGTIIRALGHDLKPILIQFLKLHDENSKHSGFFIGEVNFLKNFIPVKQFGGYDFIYSVERATKEDNLRAQNGLKFAKKTVMSGEYDLVALDEIVDTIKLNLIKMEDVLDILKNKPNHVEIIMTGHFLFEELVAISNYVTNYQLVRHPYMLGIEARPGIEY